MVEYRNNYTSYDLKHQQLVCAGTTYRFRVYKTAVYTCTHPILVKRENPLAPTL